MKISFQFVMKIFLMLGGLIWLMLFAGGLEAYPGTKSVYFLFSVVFLIMLISGLFRQKSYSYLFIVIFLWLGFWFKLTIHLIYDYPFIEPVGFFDWTPNAWDEVLWIAIVAATGVLIGRILYGRAIAGRESTIHIGSTAFNAPRWYLPIRKTIWAGVALIVVSIAIVNAVYGIQQSGLPPRAIFFWPTNALLSWMVSIGSAMGVATLMWWDISLRKGVLVGINAVILEAFFSTTSVLSRGIYIFHTIPQMLAIFKNRLALVGLSRNRVVLLIVIFVAFFGASIVLVTIFRTEFYPSPSVGSKITINQLDAKTYDLSNYAGVVIPYTINNLSRLSRIDAINKAIERARSGVGMGTKQDIKALQREKLEIEMSLLKSNKAANTAKRSGSKGLSLIIENIRYEIEYFLMSAMRLATDRWIGIEGVMAVQSYPKKDASLLLRALKEKPEIGKATLYQSVCNSHYLHMDNKKYLFASLPGPVAFLYYANSLWIVFFGMLALVLVGLFGEKLIYIMTGNVFLCALVGGHIANSIAQLGLAPRQLALHLFMIYCGIIFIYLVQSDIFYKIRMKANLMARNR